MSNLELRIFFDVHDSTWNAQWLQDDEVLFEFTAIGITEALAGLVHEVGSELAAVTGQLTKDDEE